ncbi:peptide deformylase [Treponema pedis]|nr:peptide deformylase [Treponema pedis]
MPLLRKEKRSKKMKVLYMGEQSLREVSVPVEKIDEELKDFITEMFKTLKKQDGIGLAAPQVGRNIRLFIATVGGEKYIFINPQIIETSQEQCSMEEGCLSIPKIYEVVQRPSNIRVQFMNIEGKIKTIDADGLLARVIQHENDHLNGVLFLDRLDEATKEQAVKRFEQKKALLLKNRV